MTTEVSNNAGTMRSSASWKWPIFAVCVAAIGVSYFVMPAYEDVADHVGYMLRVTARIAFAFLLLAYVAHPLQRMGQFSGAGKSLVRHRRYLGLSMAIAHTVHFFYVAYLITELDAPVETITLVFGGLAFVLMWLMAATSNDVSMRMLKRHWKRLHTIGVHYLWLIFMQSFIPRAFAGDAQILYAVLSIAGFAALGLRVWAYRQARSNANPDG